MPIEERLPFLFGTLGVGIGVKAFVILFVIFYLVFVLIIFRQIQLMDRALPTPIAPFLKFLGIVQIGVALAFLFVILGLF